MLVMVCCTAWHVCGTWLGCVTWYHTCAVMVMACTMTPSRCGSHVGRVHVTSHVCGPGDGMCPWHRACMLPGWGM